MSPMLEDLKSATRLLWKDKSFTATVLLTLALCIGGNVAIFTVVYAVLLKPLPLPAADRILLMYNAYPAATGGDSSRGATAVPDYYDRLESLTVFKEQALYQASGFMIGGSGSAELVRGLSVTPSFFRLAGVPARLGRVFVDAEGEIGNEQKVVLSSAFWQRLYGGDPSVVGQDLLINDRPHQIVGVMPTDFTFSNQDVQLWAPLAFSAEQKSDDRRHSNSWQMLGRLSPGSTLTQAQAQIDRLNETNLDRFPQYKELLIDADFHTVVVPFQDALVRDFRSVLYLLWGGALFVLLIGGVNVANLVLIRSNVRLKELGIRHALGASRGRLARQLLTESVLLTLLAAVLGLVIGLWSLQLLGALGADELPRGGEIALDRIAVLLTLGLAGLLGLALGLVPVVSMSPDNLQSVLRQETRNGTPSSRVQSFRTTLVTAQIAVAFVLIIGALLMFVSFQRLLSIDPGFRADHLLTARVSLPAVRYPSDESRRTFAERALERLRRVPGVIDASLTSAIPFGNDFSYRVIRAVGYEPDPGESLIAPSSIVVDARYFETMQVPLLEGRFFDARDTADSMPAIIIDDKLARKFWGTQSPIGGQMYADVELTEETTLHTVIGVVVEHTLYGVVDVPAQIGAYFFPHAQQPIRAQTFTIRTRDDPQVMVNTVRAEVSALDPELPPLLAQTMEELISKHLMTRRTPMLIAVAFAAIALLLSIIGIYGLLAYRVTQRTREFGVRLALGSTVDQLFRLVLFDGAQVLGVGLTFGVAGSFLLRNVVASQLYEIQAMDPIVLAVVMAILTVVTFLACVFPARRATQIDPAAALNYE
jgi:predicted permease